MAKLASISECIVCGDRNFGNFTYCSDKCESDDYPRIEMKENVEELKVAVAEIRNSISSLSADINVVANQVRVLANTLNEIIKK